MVTRGGKLLPSPIEFAPDGLGLLSHIPHDLLGAKVRIPRLDVSDNATKSLSCSFLQGFVLCGADNHGVGLALLLNGDNFLPEFYPTKNF
jgi:hypothetical protein